MSKEKKTFYLIFVKEMKEIRGRNWPYPYFRFSEKAKTDWRPILKKSQFLNYTPKIIKAGKWYQRSDVLQLECAILASGFEVIEDSLCNTKKCT